MFLLMGIKLPVVGRCVLIMNTTYLKYWDSVPADASISFCDTKCQCIQEFPDIFRGGAISSEYHSDPELPGEDSCEK